MLVPTGRHEAARIFWTDGRGAVLPRFPAWVAPEPCFGRSINEQRFRCLRAIADPSDPKPVAYVPSHVDTFSGEGSQVVSLNTPSFKGELLVYQNEWCPGTTNGVGGVTLVDVTNRASPRS
jgi:hypothetical protein